MYIYIYVSVYTHAFIYVYPCILFVHLRVSQHPHLDTVE